MSDALLLGLQRLGEIALLTMLPIFIMSMGERVIHAFDTVHYYEVPGLARYSVLSGVIAGALLVWVNHEPAYYDFDAVFSPRGPWAVPLPDLFRIWLDPTRYSLVPLWERVELLDLDDPITVLALISLTFAVLAILGSLRFFGLRAPRALLANLMVWAWGAGLSIYVICAGAWALNVLNFWTVVLGFLIYRHYGLKGH